MSPRAKTNAREQIMAAAYDLFYRQGYQATSMDQIIEKSGLSKPTIYNYFPTKQDLCINYLKERHQRERVLLTERIAQAEGPRERFMSIIRFVRDNMIASKFRGCGFFNMVAEVPDRKSPILGEVISYVDAFRVAIHEVTQQLKESDPRYADLDIERISQAYYVIACGAIMACQEYHEAWPLDRAVGEVERLLESSTLKTP